MLWQIRPVIQEDGGHTKKGVSTLKLTAQGWLGLQIGYIPVNSIFIYLNWNASVLV